MSMRKTEDHHHSPEQILEYLALAREIRQQHGLSANEWLAVLPTLLTLVSGKQVFYEQVGPLPNLAIPGNTRR